MSKITQLRQLDKETLQTKHLDLMREQFELRMQHKTRQADQQTKTHLLRAVRRQIAQVKTLLTEKTL